jgi:uncharacterized membrane protein
MRLPSSCPCKTRWLGLGLVLLCLAALPRPANALQAGESVSGHIMLGQKQVPLPRGEWTVAGLGVQDFDMAEIGAYGVIHSAILTQRRGNRVVAMLELNTNAVPVNDGWGRTRACQPGSQSADPALLVLTRYRTGWETSCIFLQTTATGPQSAGPESWQAARRNAAAAGLAMPPLWITAGFRITDRQDLIDARFHFDPALFLGAGPAEVATAWTAPALAADPARLGVVETISAWAIAFDSWIERGLRNQIAADAPAPPMPGVLAFESASPQADGKLLALEELYRTGALSRAEYMGQSRAAATEVPLRVERTGGIPVSVQKNISFRVFGSIVDYGLAYIVTANPATSGAITATIVVIHSIVFVLNDNYWEDYWARRTTRNADRLVDFRYVGDAT